MENKEKKKDLQLAKALKRKSEKDAKEERRKKLEPPDLAQQKKRFV